ncbi:hypothetical protein ALC62_06194, partial [Cyphomyrmex costatus]
RASQERYGDAAIGYVEICRQKTMCIIRAKICPEHKVNLRTKFYSTGLILLPDYPIFGASPDSYTNDYIIEVKCPLTEKSEDKYICKDGSVAKKFYYQMQIQMMFAKRTKGLFCMAKFDFETSKEMNSCGWIIILITLKI